MEKANLPQEYKNGIFSKIKRFFAAIFTKKDASQEILPKMEEHAKSKAEKPQPQNTIDVLREEGKKARIKNQILIQVRLHPEVLQKTSLSKLEEVSKIYDEQIEENDEKIKSLESQLKQLQIQSA